MCGANGAIGGASCGLRPATRRTLRRAHSDGATGEDLLSPVEGRASQISANYPGTPQWPFHAPVRWQEMAACASIQVPRYTPTLDMEGHCTDSLDGRASTRDLATQTPYAERQRGYRACPAGAPLGVTLSRSLIELDHPTTLPWALYSNLYGDP